MEQRINHNAIKAETQLKQKKKKQSTLIQGVEIDNLSYRTVVVYDRSSYLSTIHRKNILLIEDTAHNYTLRWAHLCKSLNH